MPYKGNDLDLQTPRSEPREPAGAAPPMSEPPPRPTPQDLGPVAVDELVLACCNGAYDIAKFHGAAGVGLEHLLHALTRVAPAAQKLADLGLRVDWLRRETAAAIAAEAPAGPGWDGSPRASAALADALRRAGERAARRLAPASLDDLLRALLGGGPGSPAATLLMRAAADPQRLERWQAAPLQEALPSRAPQPTVPAAAGEAAAVLGEALSARLAQIEAGLAALRAEAAADRKMLADLLRSVESGLAGLQAQSAKAPAADPGPAVAALLDSKLGAVAGTMAALAERIAAADKPAAGEEDWQELDTRLAAVEGRLAARTSEAATTLATTLSARLEETQAELQRLLQGASEQQAALTAMVRKRIQAAEEAAEAHGRHLAEVYQALEGLGTSQHTLGESFAAWRAECGGDIGIVSNRLQQLEQAVLDLSSQVTAEVQALRQEREEALRRGNGFKRWLYGTNAVLSGSWRDDVGRGR